MKVTIHWFDIIELLDARGCLIGYYCDVVTPLRKENGEFFLNDLMLDLWIFPDGRTIELDWDEFEEAARDELISPEEQKTAADTLHWMVIETHNGNFPSKYIN